MSVRAADRAADMPPDRWDALVGRDDFFLSHRWLRVVEATSGARMRYLLRDSPSGGITAGLATALADTTAPWLHGRPDTLLEHCAGQELPGAAECRRALGTDLTASLMPSLVCGGRHLGRSRVLSAGPGAPEEAETVTEMVTEAEELAAEVGARSVSFPYVDERDTVLRQVLTGRGYHCHVSGRYSWLPLPPGGFQGYLGLLSAHRRRRVRAERRQLATAGVATRVEPLTEAIIPRLAELETALLTKYGMRWMPEQSARILCRVAEVLGSSALVSLARQGNRIDGFALVLPHRDQWYAHRAGFDYARQGTLPLYYDVLFYQLVAEAAAAGITGIHYGVGSQAAKQSRGCVAVDQHAFVLPLDQRPPPDIRCRPEAGDR